MNDSEALSQRYAAAPTGQKDDVQRGPRDKDIEKPSHRKLLNARFGADSGGRTHTDFSTGT